MKISKVILRAAAVITILVSNLEAEGLDQLKNVESIMKECKVPGMTIGLIKDGKMYFKAYGVKETGKEDKVTTDTVFEAGSISKPLFAYGVMKLIKEGKLSLDDKLSKYVSSEEFGIDPYFKELSDKITVRMVLNHTSGLPSINCLDEALGRSNILKDHFVKQLTLCGDRKLSEYTVENNDSLSLLLKEANITDQKYKDITGNQLLESSESHLCIKDLLEAIDKAMKNSPSLLDDVKLSEYDTEKNNDHLSYLLKKVYIKSEKYKDITKKQVEDYVDQNLSPKLREQNFYNKSNVKDLLKELENVKLPILFDPGTDSMYSSEAFYWLQKVVEKITNKSLEDYMQKNVLIPLGMTHSSYIWRGNYPTKACGHSKGAIIGNGIPLGFMNKAEFKESDYEKIPNYTYAAGSLHTTVEDYTKFMMTMMNQENFVEEMFVKNNPKSNFGIGWVIEKTKNGDIKFWHNGCTGSFSSQAIGLKNIKQAVVFFTNFDEGDKAIHEIMETNPEILSIA